MDHWKIGFSKYTTSLHSSPFYLKYILKAIKNASLTLMSFSYRLLRFWRKINNSPLKTIIFQYINGTETQKIHFVVKHHSVKGAYPQNFNRVKFIIHRNTFAGSIRCMPTICPKTTSHLHLIDITRRRI